MSKFSFPAGYAARLYRADLSEYVTVGGCTATEAQALCRQAAEFIEQNPRRYLFKKAFVPNGDDPSSVGCMLGWIGHFAGAPAELPVNRIASNILGVTDMGFYLFHPPAKARLPDFDAYMAWLTSPVSYETASGAAAHLRAYAEYQLPKMKLAA